MTAAPAILKFQHSSLQYSDSEKQQRHDLAKLFREGKAFPIKSGTEAGPDPRSHNANRYLLREVAKEHNHRLAFWRDNWVAVDRAIIKPGSVVTGGVLVADGDETVGPGHDSGFCTFQFTHRDPTVGEVNVAACHMATKGRKPGDPNYRVNQRYSDYLGRWATRAGRGNALAFVVGDFNRPDDAARSFLIGHQRLTSAGDELGKWRNTGHGPIDGILSFDGDGRVSAKWVQVLNDKAFFLHSDHFVVRAAYTVNRLRVPA